MLFFNKNKTKNKTPALSDEQKAALFFNLILSQVSTVAEDTDIFDEPLRLGVIVSLFTFFYFSMCLMCKVSMPISSYIIDEFRNLLQKDGNSPDELSDILEYFHKNVDVYVALLTTTQDLSIITEILCKQIGVSRYSEAGVILASYFVESQTKSIDFINEFNIPHT